MESVAGAGGADGDVDIGLSELGSGDIWGSFGSSGAAASSSVEGVDDTGILELVAGAVGVDGDVDIGLSALGVGKLGASLRD